MAVWWAGGVAGVAYRWLIICLLPVFSSLPLFSTNHFDRRSTPRRLGKVYCSNRPGVVFFLKDGVWTELAGGEK